MEKAWKQIFAAVILGLLVPQLVLSAGAWLTRSRRPETQPQATEMTNPPPAEETAANVPVYLPVLTGNAHIRVMELEDYVFGVVLAEMPASFEPEALKAQAVAVRTYAMRRFTRGDTHPDGAVCTDSGCCQAYIALEDYLAERGSQADADKILRAVQETAGLVLTYGGELAESTYFSCSGGRTEDALEVWGAEYPYLQSVDSPGEENAVSYRVSKTFTSREFADALGRSLSGDPAGWLGKTTYTQGGGIKTMDICDRRYTGTQLRDLLGLGSTSFYITATGEGITVEVAGKGHRVGMSQYGADAMAAEGKSYQQILSYYYAGTGIDKISAIG